MGWDMGGTASKAKKLQVIREDGPQTHLKNRHPDNGGVFCACGGCKPPVWSGFVVGGQSLVPVRAVCALTLAMLRLAGWTMADSAHKSNKGISPR